MQTLRLSGSRRNRSFCLWRVLHESVSFNQETLVTKKVFKTEGSSFKGYFWDATAWQTNFWCDFPMSAERGCVKCQKLPSATGEVRQPVSIEKKKEAKRFLDIAILELQATYTAISILYEGLGYGGNKTITIEVGDLDRINAKIRALKRW